MNISGIYKIHSIAMPMRCYIGSSVNMHKRWNGHLSYLKRNKHANKKLQNHYNKYGKDDLQFTVLLACRKDLLLDNEQFFIDSYPVYFNECLKAGSCLGRQLSKEHKERISESNKGHKGPCGYKHTKEAKIKIGLAAKVTNTGRIHTEEHKLKISKGGKRAWELRRLNKL
jgi:group I intron endonuclease